MHHQLVPGDAAGPRLVRVRHEPSEAVRRSLRRDDEGVRAVLVAVGADRGDVGRVRRGARALDRQRLVAGERAQHRIEPEEEGRADDEAGRDILAVDREQLGEPDFAGVLLRIAVETGGIAVEQRAHVGRLLHVIACHGRAGVEPVDDEIGLRPILPADRAEPAASHRQHFLESREIVLGVGVGDAIGDVGIGLAEDVRHAEIVASDAHVIGARRRRRHPLGKQRLPGGEPDRDQDDERGQRQADATEPFHCFFSGTYCSLPTKPSFVTCSALRMPST